jgi:hypothetical protein
MRGFWRDITRFAGAGDICSVCEAGVVGVVTYMLVSVVIQDVVRMRY